MPMATPTTSWDDDARLVRCATVGDAPSRERLELHLNCIPRFLARRNRALGWPFSTDELDELVQETFVRVLSSLASYGGRSSVETWVARICDFVIVDALRLRGRSQRDESLEVESVELQSAPCQQERASLHAAVEALVRQMPREELRVLELRAHCGLSFERIAELLRSKPNAVKARYYRALVQLRRRLGDL